jgi:putative phosphoribosyl transferase
MKFKDRVDAGQKLAEELKQYKNNENAIALALPRGGVVLGFEIAKALNIPLDIVVPRKIGHPMNPEFAIGAITETGEGIFDQQQKSLVDPEWLKKEVEKEKKEAIRRLKTYRGDQPKLELKDKIVIIIDDGIATGLTMKAAIKMVKEKQPQKIVVAVPVSASDSLAEIKTLVDEVVCLYVPMMFNAIGTFYDDFGQTSDEEVVELMGKARKL